MTILRHCSLALAAIAAGCSSVSVESDYDDRVDFTLFQTYAWPPQPALSEAVQARGGGDFLIERIQDAVDEELQAKGMREVAVSEANLLVTHRIGVVEKLQVNDPFFSYDQYTTYEEGTLLIDLEDARTKKLLWRGTGQTRLKEIDEPEEREERVREVVRAILAQYPPER